MARGFGRSRRRASPNPLDPTDPTASYGTHVAPLVTRSSSLAQFDDREMLAACCEVDVKIESRTAPTANLHLRLSARRISRPTFPRLESRCATSCKFPEVGFVGRPAIQPSVWPIAVVPGDEQRDFFAKGVSAAGDHDPSCALVLQRENKPFDDGDTAVLTDGAEPLVDSLATTPRSKCSRDELPAVIGDHVLRCGPRRSNRPTER